MKYAAALMVCLGALAACNKGPEINEKNASVEDVAQKVREAAADHSLVEPGKWQTKVSLLAVDIPGMPPQMAAQMKQFIDGTGGLWLKGEMEDKAAGIFVGTGTIHGGQETTAITTMVVDATTHDGHEARSKVQLHDTPT